MEIPKELKGLGLRSPVKPKRRRLVMTTEGDWASGKSDFVMRTAPRPLLKINIDKNLEGIEERYVEDDILIYDVEMPEKIDMKKDIEQFYKVRRMVITSLEKGLFRTISIDTGDALWELDRRGFIGALDFGAAEQKDYTEANGAMRKIYRAAKENRTVNLIVSHRLTEERVDEFNKETGKKKSRVTGNRTMAGWKHTKFESQCHVRFDKVSSYECGCKVCRDPAKCRLKRFMATIVKCTANEAAEGVVFRGRDITFANIGTTVFPSTEDTPEVWESD